MSCPDCFKGAVHAHSEPQGKEETVHGVLTYIAGGNSSAAEGSSTSTILYITDAFGFNIPNGKLLADEYAAKTGLRVLVPDIIPGGGVPAFSLELFEAAGASVRWWNIWGHVRKAFTIVRCMTIFIPFMLRSGKAFPSILAYARSVRAGLPAGAKLGAAGFCWGGLQVAMLSKEPAVEGGSDPLLDAAFIAHPAGPRKPDEFAGIAKRFHVPTVLAIGDQDMVLPKGAVDQIEAALRREYEETPEKLEVTVYPGCSHGFAVRASPKKEIENEAATKATEQAVRWFKNYLF